MSSLTVCTSLHEFVDSLLPGATAERLLDLSTSQICLPSAQSGRNKQSDQLPVQLVAHMLLTPLFCRSLVILLVVPRSAAAYGQSLQDCKAVAATFLNTCAHGDYDTPSSSVPAMQSEAFACAGKQRSGLPSGRPPGVGS